MPDAETFFSAVGDAVPFPDEAIEKDFAWSEAHPIADAYRAHRPMPYDASTTAMAAVFYAVRPKDNSFSAVSTRFDQRFGRRTNQVHAVIIG